MKEQDYQVDTPLVLDFLSNLVNIIFQIVQNNAGLHNLQAGLRDLQERVRSDTVCLGNVEYYSRCFLTQCIKLIQQEAPQLEQTINKKLQSTYGHDLKGLQKLFPKQLIEQIHNKQTEKLQAKNAIIQIRTALQQACEKYKNKKSGEPFSDVARNRFDTVQKLIEELKNVDNTFAPNELIQHIWETLNKGYSPLSLNKDSDNSLRGVVNKECQEMFKMPFITWKQQNTALLEPYNSMKELLSDTQNHTVQTSQDEKATPETSETKASSKNQESWQNWSPRTLSYKNASMWKEEKKDQTPDDRTVQQKRLSS